MKFIDLARKMTIQDAILLSLDEAGLSDAEIAAQLGISKTTIHNTKKKLKPLLDALKGLE